MSRLRATSRWWWGMAVLVLALGCAAQPQPAPVVADPVITRAASVIQAANEVYRTVAIESAQAYFNGELDETTYLKIKQVSARMEQALRAAKAGVEVYNIVKSVDNAEGAEALVSSLDAVKDELRLLWEGINNGQ